MRIRTTRSETFSDGVMAIIITIMVLEIMPDFRNQSGEIDAILYLREHLACFVAYVLSFVMISIFWINHHHMFHLLEHTDDGLLRQNLFFLFWVTLIPMATSFLGEDPESETSAAFYGFVLLMNTLSFALMRMRVTRQKLVHKDQDRNVEKKITKISIRAKTKSLLGAAAYLVSIPLAFVNVYFSFACFIIPPLIFFVPDGIDDEKVAEKIAEKND